VPVISLPYDGPRLTGTFTHAGLRFPIRRT
jgi:hypothetical protein